jgi:pimeloyl-ACP methyl ester carboxylesterase
LGTDSNGSQTLICSPSSVSGWPWTATLVIFAHGYVNPYFPAKKIPWDQYSIGGVNAYDMVTTQGYYFASTSYRANGLVVQDAIQDLLLVRQKAISKIRSDYPFYFAINVILAGVSEGGLITTLSVERYPSSYTGGLAMCGPIGDFKQQIDYWGDFRALYDAYYPGEIRGSYGGDAVTIPNSLIYDWYGNLGDSTLKQSISNMVLVDQARTEDLLTVAGAPYGDQIGNPGTVDPANIQSTITGLLDYNIFATMNGEAVLGDNPYGNIGRHFSSPLIENLDSLVQDYTADQTALNNLGSYQTSGHLSKPLVVLQTTGDPIVPYWHATEYAQKVALTGYNDFAVDTVTRYGHCAFNQDEILAAFSQLGGFITNLNIAQAQTNLSEAQQQEYLDFLKSEGKLP